MRFFVAAVLLADEPTRNLDEQTEREIMAVIEEFHAVTGITVLLVTHAGQLAPRGTRAVHMAGGKIGRDERLGEQVAADTTT